MSQQTKAAEFRRLHSESRPLVLPNAWDAASARIFEDTGFPCIGTTSAGIAWALGYPDGQRVSREEMLEAVRRIVRTVQVPVSADIEAGYGDAPEEVATTVRSVIDAGAVGINLEDSPGIDGEPLAEISLQVEKIRAVREAASQAGAPLFINARTDVYLMSVGKPESRFDNALRRARAYREAGADGIFVPGLAEANVIADLVRTIDAPLNILANAGVPSVSELGRLGVARISIGSGAIRATLSLVRHIAGDLLEQGTYTNFTEGTISYADVNRLLDNAPDALSL